MNHNIIDFVHSQRVCVLAVEMMDGSPHAATVHCALQEDPFMLFFETKKTCLKSEALFGREQSRASVVIGFDETVMKTLQIDGIVRRISDDEKEAFNAVYFGKFPEKIGRSSEDAVLFACIPTWWRFTDWKTPDGKIILTSTD